MTTTAPAPSTFARHVRRQQIRPKNGGATTMYNSTFPVKSFRHFRPMRSKTKQPFMHHASCPTINFHHNQQRGWPHISQQQSSEKCPFLSSPTGDSARKFLLLCTSGFPCPNVLGYSAREEAASINSLANVLGNSSREEAASVNSPATTSKAPRCFAHVSMYAGLVAVGIRSQYFVIHGDDQLIDPRCCTIHESTRRRSGISSRVHAERGAGVGGGRLAAHLPMPYNTAIQPLIIVTPSEEEQRSFSRQR